MQQEQIAPPEPEDLMKALPQAQAIAGRWFVKPLPELLSPKAGYEAACEAEIRKGGPAAFYFQSFAPAVMAFGAYEGRMNGSLRAMQLRAAITLYERANRKRPNKLDALVPDYLPIVPEDPFSGEPLKYGMTPDGWRIWSVGEDLKDDAGVAPEAGNPFVGPDYVFFSTVPTNEERRGNRAPGPGGTAQARPRTEDDFRNELAALKDVLWKREDPVQKNLTWYAVQKGLVVADAEKREVKPFTELLGERDFGPSSIVFSKDKVWIGTSKGLFVWDRKDMFWTRFAVGGVLIDSAVKDLELSPEGALSVVVQDGENQRRFEFDAATSKWTEK
jgi:hypothetical protein